MTPYRLRRIKEKIDWWLVKAWQERFVTLIRWIKCNIFNKHDWWYMGDKDLYGNLYWKCSHCNRIKYKSYDRKKVDEFKAELYSKLFK